MNGLIGMGGGMGGMGGINPQALSANAPGPSYCYHSLAHAQYCTHDRLAEYQCHVVTTRRVCPAHVNKPFCTLRRCRRHDC